MTFASRIFACFVLLAALYPLQTNAQTLAERLSGRILLQVRSHGEAWYVDPVLKQRFYLGRAEDAYSLMRTRGLGIRHAELRRYLAGRFPARLSGRIMLDVEARGEAYYVVPQTLRGIYLGRAADAYALMRTQGLGITNEHLATIPLAPNQTTPAPAIRPIPTPVRAPYDALEREAFDQINAHRRSKNTNPLTWNDEIAAVARQHSLNMANGTVAFGHDGFEERARIIQEKIPLQRFAENVAYNDYDDPATTSVVGWIESEGHRINLENSVYTLSGMGVAKSSDGAYYFTQLFVTP